jgi:hypothetical protein
VESGFDNTSSQRLGEVAMRRAADILQASQPSPISLAEGSLCQMRDDPGIKDY